MTPYYQDNFAVIYHGDCRDVLRALPDQSVNCCVTSPPYFGLRDYNVEGQIGLEPTPEEYVAQMVAVFREVRRVLRNDGTCWINLGDSFIKKEVAGIPWRVAFALQADGWKLRQDIIWSKPNPMPESVTDRCTKSHEYIFMLTKSARYYYDQEAIMEPAIYADDDRIGRSRVDHKSMPTEKVNDIRPRTDKQRGHSRRHQGFNERWDAMEKTEQCGGMRNRRSVWNVAPAQFHECHFATFPPDLIEPCILAGCPEGGTVLDPFLGSGTTARVANQLKRKVVGIELNAEYLELIKKRTSNNQIRLIA